MDIELIKSVALCVAVIIFGITFAREINHAVSGNYPEKHKTN
jgi:hypothetical protein